MTWTASRATTAPTSEPTSADPSAVRLGDQGVSGASRCSSLWTLTLARAWDSPAESAGMPYRGARVVCRDRLLLAEADATVRAGAGPIRSIVDLSMAPDFAINGRAFALDEHGILYRSEDFGSSWTSVSSHDSTVYQLATGLEGLGLAGHGRPGHPAVHQRWPDLFGPHRSFCAQLPLLAVARAWSSWRSWCEGAPCAGRTGGPG